MKELKLSALKISDCIVAILAGGLATRLKPITEKIPKSLLEVAGRPFIDHQIELLKSNGIKKMVLCTSYLEEKIKASLGTGNKFGVDIFYSSDGEKLLGTGGAIKKSLPLLSDPFFVLYGDSYLNTDYEKILNIFHSSGKQGLMALYKNKNQWDTSNVWFESGSIQAYDKKSHLPQMEYIDYGLSMFSKKAFECHQNKFDLYEVFSYLLKNNQLAGYEVSERFYEIGSPQGLLELETKLGAKKS